MKGEGRNKRIPIPILVNEHKRGKKLRENFYIRSVRSMIRSSHNDMCAY